MKYAKAMIIFGALLFAITYGVENGLYQGFGMRLGHDYHFWAEPFPKGPLTITLYSLAFVGLLIVVIAFVLVDRGNGEKK
jgi:hypothetical protein